MEMDPPGQLSRVHVISQVQSKEIVLLVSALLHALHVTRVEQNRLFLAILLQNLMNVDVNKCLKQIKLHISFHTCATYPELPSNINTMIKYFWPY